MQGVGQARVAQGIGRIAEVENGAATRGSSQIADSVGFIREEGDTRGRDGIPRLRDQVQLDAEKLALHVRLVDAQLQASQRGAIAGTEVKQLDFSRYGMTDDR